MTKENLNFSNINTKHINKNYDFICKVENIIQTTGPTLFKLYDGHSILTAKAFIKPGVRAFSNINVEDVVSVSLKMISYDNNIEGEIKSMSKLENSNFNLILESIENERSLPKNTSFKRNNETYEKLKPEFIEAATLIRKAIYSNRPIIIRHHNDTDGYCSGVAIERAILPLIEELHSDNKWHYYKISPSRTPFYDYTDALKDLTYTLKDEEKFGSKIPLIILVDHGSGEENILSLNLMKQYGVDFIVVDHHLGNYKEIDKLTKVHINHHKINSNLDLSAGMLSFELANFINDEVKNINFLPALSGIGDRIKGEELDYYLQLAKEIGYDKEDLIKYSEVLDFQSYFLKFMEARNLIGDLLGDNLEAQKNQLNIIYPILKEKIDLAKKAMMKYLSSEIIEGKKVYYADIVKSSLRDYPPAGKIIGLIKDDIQKNENDALILGHTFDSITFRACDNLNFNFHDFMDLVKSKLPESLVDGGGHEKVGTIRFIENSKEEIFEILRKYLLSIK